MALNLYTVAPDTPFLDAIARGWLNRRRAVHEESALSLPLFQHAAYASGEDPGSDQEAVSRGLILLPTRRAVRAMAEAFLRVNDGKALLLPRIAALGAMDETPLALSGALDLPPAVEPMRRLAALTRLILAMDGRNGAPRTADRAWPLARELADLMDEAEFHDIDLRERLPDAADPAFAHHWAETLKFLHIVTDYWPQWLKENGVMNPAARQVALLDAQTRAWEENPPEEPVLIAGTTGGTPSVRRLLRVVARMPDGQVVLPQLDRVMDGASWDALEHCHAQAGLAGLLAGIGATRQDVQDWNDDEGPRHAPMRFPLLSQALLPAASLHRWMDRTQWDLDGLWRLTPADQQQEALAIAMILRDAMETPGAQAALVTPDRTLAERVTAALLRFGIVADDSAGEKLSATPPAVFMRLLVQAVAEDLAPVPLLALLKHPLAAAGLDPVACRDTARLLETLCLRGPRPLDGLKGLRKAVDGLRSERDKRTLAGFLTRLEKCLEPALRFDSAMAIPAADAFTAIIEAAERLAATPDTSGARRLWAGEEGDALSTRLGEVQEACDLLPDLRRGVLPGLLDQVLEGAVVRSRRALRGRTGTEHPRVFIWGLLEARLQSVDLIVLGGLAETVWPPLVEPGPWLSRPMRIKTGLPAPEETVGQSAHDFLAACCSAPQIVLSCPERCEGAPAVPARWLTRLDMFLAGRDQALPRHPAAAWARALDLPPDGPQPVRPPMPCPPVHLRPRRLSVTKIETWLRDPYSIHAEYILRLPVLRPLDEETDAADYGMIVHDGLRRFLERHRETWPQGAAAELRSAMEQALGAAGLRQALREWWTPRLERIADWVAATEADRRNARPPVAILPEADGKIELSRPGGLFTLSGRADRLERYADGTLAILDYKTGQPPSEKSVELGLSPQLILEAAMAAEGGFGVEWKAQAAELAYWHLSGGIDPGKATLLFSKAPAEIPKLASRALHSLSLLIDAFDKADRPYLASPIPAQAPRFANYDQLARVPEWSFAGGGDE